MKQEHRLNRHSIQFAGDHRPMRKLGEALRRSTAPTAVEIEDWQMISVGEGCKPSERQSPRKNEGRKSRCKEIGRVFLLWGNGYNLWNLGSVEAAEIACKRTSSMRADEFETLMEMEAN